MMRKEIIGNATLYCGDCLDIMQSLEQVSHIISDPPYEESLHAVKLSERIGLRKDCGPRMKAIDFASIDSIREKVVDLSSRLSRGWAIFFCTVEGVARWADCINASPMKYKRACVWVKPDSTPQLNGQCPAQGAEMFVCSWAGNGHSEWNAGGKRGVYTHLCNNQERTGMHPTEKPVRLMKEIIYDFTNERDVILDPFMGSGTTGVAAVQMNRKFIGIEINEKYFSVACKRLEDSQRQGDFFY